MSDTATRAPLIAREAAAELGVSDRTVARLFREGKLPGWQIGRSIRFDPDVIAEFKRTGGNREEARAAG